MVNNGVPAASISLFLIPLTQVRPSFHMCSSSDIVSRIGEDEFMAACHFRKAAHWVRGQVMALRTTSWNADRVLNCPRFADSSSSSRDCRCARKVGGFLGPCSQADVALYRARPADRTIFRFERSMENKQGLRGQNNPKADGFITPHKRIRRGRQQQGWC